MHVSFRSKWLLAAVLPLVLAACGDSEPDQRAAFKQFLQTRILDKPGVHVPKPSAEETKAFGDYASHYAVITDFNAKMDENTKSLSGVTKSVSVRSLDDILKHREDLKTVQAFMNDASGQYKKNLAEADAAHAQLKQPEDLELVYDKAYERVVSTPAKTFLEVLPQVNAGVEAIEDVADYLEAHRAQIKIDGLKTEVQDPQVLAELNKRLQVASERSAALVNAQARLRGVMLGQ
ncbi:DUF3053 family protein [Pseudomonas phoenicis]|uniref:DUF3053 family protein n=1 Tax=unclassified Pseudomonas TaxID=196821 RepID=UPI0039A1D79B